MLKLIAGIASLLVAATSLVVPAAPVPRTSPEFAIVSPSGQSVQLSAFKGKVVVMEFLFVKSEHCLRVLRTLGKLQGELGSRGFQPVGVVFDPPNTSVDGRRLAATMQDYFKLTFPVGYSSKEDVDRYLGRTRQEILSIPQVIVIDRSGTIRAASGGRAGDLTLEDESSLRNLIGKLLDENH
jgi:cytochrome oxidase Cu insertion factor (SCO1/SenC/PrrC family)